MRLIKIYKILTEMSVISVVGPYDWDNAEDTSPFVSNEVTETDLWVKNNTKNN